MKKIYVQPETEVVKMGFGQQALLNTSDVGLDQTPVNPGNSDAPRLDIPSSVFDI